MRRSKGAAKGALGKVRMAREKGITRTKITRTTVHGMSHAQRVRAAKKGWETRRKAA